MPPILFCKKQKKKNYTSSTHQIKNTTKKKKIVNILLIYNHKGEREDLRAAHQTHPTFEAPKNCTHRLSQTCRSRSPATSEDEPPEKHGKGRSTHLFSIKPQYKPQIEEKLEFRKIRVFAN